MTAEVNVCEVTPETIGHAVSLLQRFFSEEGFDTPPLLIAANLAAMVNDGSCWAGLADTGGVFVGVVTVTTMLYVEWGRLGEIGDLYVVPVHRRRGVASALSHAALDWCRARGCSAASVVITPDGEHRHNLATFYGGLGFERTGRTIMSRRI
jgi:GNAT superfamily N-acetyltransferase